MNFLIVGKTSSKGFRDITAGQHYGAFVEQYRDYRWNGIKYKETDCYETIFPQPDERGDSERPVIANCR